jgi:hypothetical protein
LQSHRYPHFSLLASSLPTEFLTTPSQPDSHHPIWQYHHPHHHLQPPLSLWEKCSNRQQQSWLQNFGPHGRSFGVRVCCWQFLFPNPQAGVQQ